MHERVNPSSPHALQQEIAIRSHLQDLGSAAFWRHRSAENTHIYLPFPSSGMISGQGGANATDTSVGNITKEKRNEIHVNIDFIA